MKAGLITFHRADNMGAVLQAAALQQHITDHICRCELVDFVPNDQAFKRSLVFQFKGILVKLRRVIKKDRAAKFQAFRRKNYCLSGKTYYGDQALQGCAPAYDVMISGSDQILNTTLSDTSESFYLAPWTNTKKISYASSFGRSDITEDEYRLIRRELPGFAHLSAREGSAAQLIENEIGREVQVVCDPVFLLDKEAWLKKSEKTAVSGQYAFVYAMEYSQTMEAAICSLMKEMPVYLLCGSESAKKLPGQKITDCGPGEFLRYIASARQVLTNSFHGTAFSMIFGKPLLCVAHTTRNARLQNILQQSGNGDKLIATPQDAQDLSRMEIDGEAACEALKPLIVASKEYLKTALSKE